MQICSLGLGGPNNVTLAILKKIIWSDERDDWRPLTLRRAQSIPYLYLSWVGAERQNLLIWNTYTAVNVLGNSDPLLRIVKGHEVAAVGAFLFKAVEGTAAVTSLVFISRPAVGGWGGKPTSATASDRDNWNLKSIPILSGGVFYVCTYSTKALVDAVSPQR